MDKKEILSAIDEYTAPHFYGDTSYDRESFIKGFLVALRRSYEISHEEYEELEAELL